ncbi:hypothetical protein BKA70DRAFT_1239219 [Coprinopsis sp. MPI-PUGE-AT-0042]|nr:hypothetical protein BKA70DRAFT_1239219 [Coprinopsis sp. MPI-PUGE-AT-0042]
MSLMDLSMSESGRDDRIKEFNVEACMEMTKSGSVASSNGPTAAAADQETAVGLGGTRHNLWKGMEKSLEILWFGCSCKDARPCPDLCTLLPTRNTLIPVISPPQRQAEQSARGTLVNPDAFPPTPHPYPRSKRYTKSRVPPILPQDAYNEQDGMGAPPRNYHTPLPVRAKPTTTVRPVSDIALAHSPSNIIYMLSMGASTPFNRLKPQMPLLPGPPNTLWS